MEMWLRQGQQIMVHPTICPPPFKARAAAGRGSKNVDSREQGASKVGRQGWARWRGDEQVWHRPLFPFGRPWVLPLPEGETSSGHSCPPPTVSASRLAVLLLSHWVEGPGVVGFFSRFPCCSFPFSVAGGPVGEIPDWYLSAREAAGAGVGNPASLAPGARRAH